MAALGELVERVPTTLPARLPERGQGAGDLLIEASRAASKGARGGNELNNVYLRLESHDATEAKVS